MKKEHGSEQARSPHTNTSPRAGSYEARDSVGQPQLPAVHLGEQGRDRARVRDCHPKGETTSPRTNSENNKHILVDGMGSLGRGGRQVGGAAISYAALGKQTGVVLGAGSPGVDC